MFLICISVIYLGQNVVQIAYFHFEWTMGKKNSRQRECMMKILQRYPFVFSRCHLFKAKLMIVVCVRVCECRFLLLRLGRCHFFWNMIEEATAFKPFKIVRAEGEENKTNHIKTMRMLENWLFCQMPDDWNPFSVCAEYGLHFFLMRHNNSKEKKLSISVYS